ncbi:MAG: hypothetical protein R6U96_13515 [Promethearchaeia archaeon]
MSKYKKQLDLSDREIAAIKTENEILEFLKKQETEISFYDLYKSLNFTSGKAQSALKRLKKRDTIHTRKKIDKFKTFVWHKEFEVEPEVIEIEDESTMIFPVRLDKKVGTILQEVPEVSDGEYSDFMDLIKTALIYFFQENISPEQKKTAIQNAVKKKKITKELAKEILGG